MKSYFLIIAIYTLSTSCSTSRDIRAIKETISAQKSPTTAMNKKIVQTDFIDKTRQFGLEGVEAYNFNVVDINGDNYSDIVILPSFYSQPEFYYFNIHKKIFEKGKSPFTSGLRASFLLFYDFNKDKVLDVVAGVLNQKSEMSKKPLRIFYGKNTMKGLVFSDAKKILAPTPNSSVGIIDYNLDGNLDLYIGNWFRTNIKKETFPTRDYLLIHDGDEFKDNSKLLLGETKENLDKTMFVNATPTYGVQICDMDQNGFPDILTASTNGYANKMWLNRYKVREKTRYFEDFGIRSGYGGDVEGNLVSQGGGRTFGVACADYNNDGIMDAFLGELSHNYDHDGVDKSSLLTGSKLKFPPQFIRTEYFLDEYDINWHQADRRGVWFDYNNDGLLDLLVDNSGYPPHTKLILFKQEIDHSFTNVSKEAGIGIVNPIASVTADFNRDGRLDILTAQSSIRDAKIKNRIFLFENNVDIGKRKSLRFFPRGRNANYHGLNGMIILKVRTPEGVVYRRQTISYSYGALPPQIEEGILFGIDEGERVISVTMRWPYSKSLNQDRAGLEKHYKIDFEFDKFMNLTLCENGDILVGRRDCS